MLAGVGVESCAAGSAAGGEGVSQAASRTGRPWEKGWPRVWRSHAQGLASGLLSLPRACCTLSLILPVGGVKACMKVPCFNASRQAHTAHGALVVCRYSQVVAHAAVEGWAGLHITGLQLSASPPRIGILRRIVRILCLM